MRHATAKHQDKIVNFATPKEGKTHRLKQASDKTLRIYKKATKTENMQ